MSRVYLVLPRVVMDEIVDNLIDRESWALRAPSSCHPSAAGPGHPHAPRFELLHRVWCQRRAQRLPLQHRVWCQRREVFLVRAYHLYMEDRESTLLHPLWEKYALALAQVPVPSVHASCSCIRACIGIATRINMTPRYI